MSLEIILQQAKESIIKCDRDKAIAVAKQALAEGLDPVEVLSKGFSEGIQKIGDLFGRGEVFLDIIGTSALLTTTITEQKKLEEVLRKEGLRDRFKTMVGGAPCTQRWADRIGANAYAEDAAEAVTKALALLGAK